MPGIFGIVSNSPEQIKAFASSVSIVWPDCQWHTLDHGIIGAHGLRGDRRLFACQNHVSAIEGDSATGQVLRGKLQIDNFFRSADGHFYWKQNSLGCGCVYSRRENSISLTSDCTTGFPLFYAHEPGLFAFSTLQKPIAKLISARRDLTGIAQFMRSGYMINGRTVFQGIRRLLPGESLHYAGDADSLQHRFTTPGYQQSEADQAATGELVERAWSAFRDAVKASFPAESQNSLMFSAGWDSRTVLAAMPPSDRAKLRLFSHGDTQSREIRLARELATSVGGTFTAGAIGAECFEVEKLEHDFAFSEHLAFPHWTKAAESLVQLGCTTVGNGIFGEIIGGHYGSTWFMQGANKYFGILRSLAGKGPALNVTAALQWTSKDHPRWLSSDCRKEYEAVVAETNADIASTCKRYEQAGLCEPVRILEVFLLEHRASQWIMGQARAQKHLVELAIPFGNQHSLSTATAIPIDQRVHNRQNRALLKRYAPDLLRLPTGAILVPASAPTLVQETSRIVEWLYENHHWRNHIKSKGRKAHARLGWDNFEFLRDGKSISSIFSSLTEDLWDKERLKHAVLEKFSSYATSRKGMGVGFESLKLLSVDLLLRQ